MNSFRFTSSEDGPTDHIIDQVTREERAHRRLKGKIKEKQPKYGDKNFTTTEGLRPVVKPRNNKPRFIVNDDDDQIDLTRVRSYKDVE